MKYLPFVFFLMIGLAMAGSVVTVGPPPAMYSTIQDAIDHVNSGTTVLVSDGTYTENINFLGKAITVTSVNGYEYCVIEGSAGQEPVVTFENDEETDSVLCGFTITNGEGYQWYESGAYYSAGGGIYCFRSGPTIKECNITLNVAFNAGAYPYGLCYGSGIYVGWRGDGESTNDDYTPLIKDNIITANDMLSSVECYGAGVCIEYDDTQLGDFTLKYNYISENDAWLGKGGGVYIGHAVGTFDANYLINNEARYSHGQLTWEDVENNSNNPVVLTNTICGADTVGGGSDTPYGLEFINCTYVYVVNCTSCDNEYSSTGANIQFYDNTANTCHVYVYNTILNGGGGSGETQVHLEGIDYCIVDHCFVDGGETKIVGELYLTYTNNSTDDPDLINSPIYHLDSDSPCIDYNSSSVPHEPDEDIDKEERDSDNDCGSDEYVG